MSSGVRHEKLTTSLNHYKQKSVGLTGVCIATGAIATNHHSSPPRIFCFMKEVNLNIEWLQY
ncbi:MAG: hypothetical protein DRH17_01640 [Deltaproteobacteria bacterium]|nr:MAG: hypothetical protein DRH17_01640 [Deltaproteobacteria bacterium]